MTVEGKQGFADFAGPLFTELEVKFRKWLELTYSKRLLLYFLSTLTISFSEIST